MGEKLFKPILKKKTRRLNRRKPRYNIGDIAKDSIIKNMSKMVGGWIYKSKDKGVKKTQSITKRTKGTKGTKKTKKTKSISKRKRTKRSKTNK